MAASPVLPPEYTEHEAKQPARNRRPLWVALFVVSAVLIAIALTWAYWWPFDPQPVVRRLEQASDSQVQYRAFRHRYFPTPGCVLEGVVFTRGADHHPVITIQKLTIKSTYLGILRRHITRMVADGMRVTIPADGERSPFGPQPSRVTIAEIVAKDVVLEFERVGQPNPLRFDIHEVTLNDVNWNGPFTYHVKLHTPDPPAEIIANGQFGVWNLQDPKMTPVSGEFQLDHADLSVFHGLAGSLTSTGKFNGNLKRIQVSGSTSSPDFEVTNSRHPIALKTDFTGYVDATNGDTVLQRVDAYFGKTHLVANGSVAGSPDHKGKTAQINLISPDARVEDLLRLTVSDDPPAMTGKASLKANAQVFGLKDFLKTLIAHGNFEVTNGQFTKPPTQRGVNKLSAGAQGNPQDPTTATIDFGGQVTLQSGTANFNDILFGVPGAKARLRGTYGLVDHRIDLRGQLKVDTQIANTTTGVKAFLLRVMGPFFKKRKRGGQILPVKIAGTYEKPSFGLDLHDKKAQEVPRPHTNREAESARR